MLDFARGHPNSSLLPSEETRCVLKDLCSKTGGAEDALWQALQYGNDEGNTSFLIELKAFLQRHTKNDDIGGLGSSTTRTDDETKTSFFVTSGVSHSLELLCATQTRPGDVVLVERPTYFLAGGIFRAHGLVVHGLPMRKSTWGPKCRQISGTGREWNDGSAANDLYHTDTSKSNCSYNGYW